MQRSAPRAHKLPRRIRRDSARFIAVTRDSAALDELEGLSVSGTMPRAIVALRGE